MAEPSERSDLLMLAAAYLAGAAPQPPLDAVVDFYIAAKAEAVRCAPANPPCPKSYTLKPINQTLINQYVGFGLCWGRSRRRSMTNASACSGTASQARGAGGRVPYALDP